MFKESLSDLGWAYGLQCNLFTNKILHETESAEPDELMSSYILVNPPISTGPKPC